MSEKDRETEAMYCEAVNEGFAAFLHNCRDREISIAPDKFKHIRWTFKVAFMHGLRWQFEKDEAAGIRPATL